MDDPTAVRFTDKQIASFFPTLVWRWQLASETHQPLNSKILAKLEELTRDNPPLDPGGMWQTDQNFHELEEMAFFRRMVQGSVTGALDFLKVEQRDFEITGCWANISGPAAPHKMHSHPNNYLSGVYYVKTQKNANSIFFHDPRAQITVISPKLAETGLATAGKVRMEVETGTLIIFPSWLQHSVDPNRSGENRVSIAFNIMFSTFTQSMSPPQWDSNVSLST